MQIQRNPISNWDRILATKSTYWDKLLTEMRKSLVVFQRKLDAFVGKQGRNPQCMLAMQNERGCRGQRDRGSDSSPVTPHCWAWARPLHPGERKITVP